MKVIFYHFKILLPKVGGLGIMIFEIIFNVINVI